jgi:fluoride ion exporter CrcB/FEX
MMSSTSTPLSAAPVVALPKTGILSANRIAGIAAFLTGLSGAILAVTNSFPKNWQNSVIAISGILGAVATAMHFMLGSQKNDQAQAQVQLAAIDLEHAKMAHTERMAELHTNITTSASNSDEKDVPSDTTSMSPVEESNAVWAASPFDAQAVSPDNPDPSEMAEPEDLNSDQWLANRKAADPEGRPETQIEPQNDVPAPAGGSA